MRHFVAGPKRPDHRSSLMSSDAKRIKKLLYLSDWSSSDVYVYDYNKGTCKVSLAA
jgi:hypothetical protein